MASRPMSPGLFARPSLFSSQEDKPPQSETSASHRSRTSSLPPASPFGDPFTAHPSGSSSFVTYDPPSTAPHSPPTLASLPKRARGSILLAASSLSFSRPSLSLRPRARPSSSSGSAATAKKGSAPASTTPFMFSEVIEIAAAPPPPTAEDDDAERERLRDAAAQSIGLDPVLLEERSLSLHSLPSEEVGDETADPPTRATTPTQTPVPALPPFPATHAALEPFIALSARVPKHTPPPSLSLLKLALARQWKIRLLLLTSAPASPRYPSTSYSSQATHTVHLHIFKSSAPGPEEREMERMEISAESRVFVAEEEVAGRRGVVKVDSGGGAVSHGSNGHNNGGGVNGMNGHGQGNGKGKTAEMALHISDPVEAQAWITAIKQAVLSQRSLRAGLGSMSPSPSPGPSPRGDLDVMLSMRAQGMLVSPSPTGSVFPPYDIPSSSSPIPSSASQRSSSITRSPNAPSTRVSSASSAVSALRGLFSGSSSASKEGTNGGMGIGTRPRSPSAASTAGSRYGDEVEDGYGEPEESFGRAGTNLLSMLRSNSITSTSRDERPTSPATLSMAPLSSSTPSTPRQTEMPILPLVHVQAASSAQAHLDRKILQDEDMVLVEAQSSGNSTPTDATTAFFRGRHPLAMTMAASTVRGAASPTPSLHPPPRRRAWTASGGVPAGPRARPESAYAYIHANASTADSFGLRQAAGSGQGSGSGVSTGLGSSFLFSATPPAEGRPRTSLSSLSSYGSGEPRLSADAGANGNGTLNPKRWSRQSALARRLTPPDGALPAVPSASGSPASFRSSMQRHPYAAEGNGSSGRASRPQSIQSTQSSPQSFILNLRDYSKRASSSSVRSVSSVSTSHSRATNGNSNGGSGNGSLFGHHRPRSSHRASMPPPQRPAPSTALPPTPAEETSTRPKTPNSAPASKTSFRDSLSLRTNRLSLSPPSLPPSSVLPPRPDEPLSALRIHRRSSSNGSATLSPIPASPTPLNPPYPPPSGPLPPTPEVQHTSRSTSIKQRLRMLSAPAPPSVLTLPPHPPSPVPSTINPYSVPSTPIGEPIAIFQNDPTFLYTAPQTPPPPRNAATPPTPEPSPEWPGVTSLSPPPRRGSRRISVQDRHGDNADGSLDPRPSTGDTAGSEVNPVRLSISLSPPTSAVSLVQV